MIRNRKENHGSGPARFDHGVKGCEGMSITELAKAHNLPYSTVYARLANGDRGEKVVEERGSSHRVICGKRFRGWIEWFKFWHDHEPSYATISASFTCLKREGKTDEEIVEIWKERWGKPCPERELG